MKHCTDLITELTLYALDQYSKLINWHCFIQELSCLEVKRKSGTAKQDAITKQQENM